MLFYKMSIALDIQDNHDSNEDGCRLSLRKNNSTKHVLVYYIAIN